MELKDTIEGMLSTDYVERFKAEYNQVSLRVKKLEKILDDNYKGKLTYNLLTPTSILEIQLEVMEDYKDVLETRAELEGIKLDLD